MPFDPKIIDAYKQMNKFKSKDGLEIEPIFEEDNIQDFELPEAPAQDFVLPEAPMGMADSLAMRSGDKPIEQPPMGMADSLGMRSGDLPKPQGVMPVQTPTTSSINSSILQSIISPQPKLKGLDFTGDTLNTVDALNKAQQDRKGQQELAMLARGLNTLGAGISNKQGETIKAVGPSEELETQIKGLEKRADESLVEFQARAAKEKDDPNSTYSKGMRDFIKKNYGIDAKGASASQISTLLPDVVKSYEMAENRKARSQDLKLKMEEMSLKREEMKRSNEEKSELRKEEKNNTFITNASKQLKSQADEFAKVSRAKALAQGMDPKNPAGQLTLLYNTISSLDPGSVVREGEISLATKAGGLRGKIETVLSQLTANPKLLDEKTVQSLRKEIDRITSAQESTYKKQRNIYMEGLKERGIKTSRMKEIDPFYEESSEEPAKEKSSGKVRVSNGKETLEIDESDLEDAKKDGYNKV